VSTFAEGGELAPVATLPDAQIAPIGELGRKPKQKGGIGSPLSWR
jgi:hypothetical protein